jgi:hypothetical protein
MKTNILELYFIRRKYKKNIYYVIFKPFRINNWGQTGLLKSISDWKYKKEITNSSVRTFKYVYLIF